MSTQINQYVIYGYQFDYNDVQKVLNEKFGEEKKEEIYDLYYDSAFKKEVVEVDGCSMLIDGYDGKYIFFGKFFEKTNNYEYLETMEVPKVSSKVKKNLEEQVQKLFGTNFDKKPKIYFVTHYR